MLRITSIVSFYCTVDKDLFLYDKAEKISADKFECLLVDISLAVFNFSPGVMGTLKRSFESSI